MPLQELIIPEFVAAPAAPQSEDTTDAASLFDAQDFQLVLNQQQLALKDLNDAKRQSLITILEQEIERLEPIVKAGNLRDTVRKIALANR